MFAILGKEDPDRYRYLLWFKFVICNLLFSAMFVLALQNGWVAMLFAKKEDASWLQTLLTFDTQTTYIVGMVGVFLFGLCLSMYRVFLTSREINFLKRLHPSQFSEVAKYLHGIRGKRSDARSELAGTLEDEWFSNLSIIKHIAYLLVLLGFMGTVLGFSIMLFGGGVKQDFIGDINAIGPLFANLMKGMGVALYTTIAGGLFGGVWLRTNLHILDVGGIKFMSLLRRRGIEQEEMKEIVEAKGV